jgi:hypothetical protein
MNQVNRDPAHDTQQSFLFSRIFPVSLADLAEEIDIRKTPRTKVDLLPVPRVTIRFQ